MVFCLGFSIWANIIKKITPFRVINASATLSSSMNCLSHWHKILSPLVLDELELFASVCLLKFYQLISTLRWQKRGNWWRLHHDIPQPWSCSHKKWHFYGVRNSTQFVWYSLFKQEGCSMSVCHGWQQAHRRPNFKQTCRLPAGHGAQRARTWCCFLCNANNLFSTNELIPFLFPFLPLCPTVTLLLPLTSIAIQRVWDESQMLLLLPDWKLKSPKGLLCHQETCFFLIVTYPSLDQLSLRNLFFPWDLAISCPINISSF